MRVGMQMDMRLDTVIDPTAGKVADIVNRTAADKAVDIVNRSAADKVVDIVNQSAADKVVGIANRSAVAGRTADHSAGIGNPVVLAENQYCCHPGAN